MNLLNELTLKLAECQVQGHTFNCLPIKGEQEVLRVEVSGLEELPIFMTVTESQILCISYLFTKEEIHQERENELNQYLLELNLPMPLSSFAVVDGYYVIFGSLATVSKFDSIVQELITLASNSTDTLQALEEFIK
ncbi:YjfI family protein [Aliikangiella sp. G2MR2-5]|uniref:YjfI family protein n=1 Tax=Aliikangiella sp. G2MR2-5 TaxID=2788943 RepID=UPI0018A95E0D|nr:DUF2170 family protein [Aliikangiella sp. G2MR2-5]